MNNFIHDISTKEKIRFKKNKVQEKRGCSTVPLLCATEIMLSASTNCSFTNSSKLQTFSEVHYLCTDCYIKTIFMLWSKYQSRIWQDMTNRLGVGRKLRQYDRCCFHAKWRDILKWNNNSYFWWTAHPRIISISQRRTSDPIRQFQLFSQQRYYCLKKWAIPIPKIDLVLYLSLHPAWR